ncbi:MAG TPA: thioredoxin domain-containing protein, partial [Polyangiaceae bacterium]
SSYPTAYPTPTFTIPTPPTATATGPVASTETHGTISEVSLGAGRPLQDQLVDLRAAAIAEGRTPVVVSTASWCGACKEVESTLDEPQMQKALANVTLLMVDVDEFGPQMDSLKMTTNAVPSFFKIDSTAHATDAITGDEWDENTAENEAPVLGPFAKGMLKKRRHPPTTGTSL